MDQEKEALGNNSTSEMVRFGPFSLNLRTGELRKHAVRVRLQAKPFQILCALLERPGHVITREELRERLWSSASTINFESGLNTAINRLRIALSDSAESPIFVETITRLGYRFIAPLERPQQATNGLVTAAAEPAAHVIVEPSSVRMPGRRTNRLLRYLKTYWPVPVFVLLLGAAAAALRIDQARERELSFQQVTFEKGFTTGARFAQDGRNIVYSARWNGRPSRLFLTTAADGRSREVAGPDARLTGFPSSGQVGFFTMAGESKKMRLETEPLTGGPPRVLSDHAQGADWAGDGKLAIITADDSYSSIEYPPGNTLYRSTARLNDLRISPNGDWLAFAEHPVPSDDGGQIAVLNVSSKESRVISSGWESIEGLAWQPSGREVWFTAATSGIERSLMAATLDGHVRPVAQIPGGMELQDVSASGKVLIDRSTERMMMMLGNLDRDGQKDISWLDWSRAVAISADGQSVLFDESGGGGGAAYSVFITETGSTTPRRIGTGRAMDLSQDGRWALAQDSSDATKLTLISTDNGRHQPVQSGGIAYRWARFIPGQLGMVFAGSYANQPLRLYKQLLPNGPVTLISADASMDAPVLSPDGRLAVTADPVKGIVAIDLLHGHERKLPLTRPAYPVVFSGNDEVVTSSVQNRTIVLSRLILSTGALIPYKRIEMTDAPGITETLPVYISRNLHTLVYSRVQSLSNLFVVSGWK